MIAAADDRADPAGRPGQHVDDRGAGDELCREDPQAAEADQAGDDAADGRAVPELEEVAGRVEAVLLGAASRVAAPTQKASTNDARPADPLHHHAFSPSR